MTVWEYKYCANCFLAQDFGNVGNCPAKIDGTCKEINGVHYLADSKEELKEYLNKNIVGGYEE